jgi:hypothetical protein
MISLLMFDCKKVPNTKIMRDKKSKESKKIGH